MVRPPLTHAESHDELPAFALGILETAEAEQVAQHVEQCADCRRELDQFNAITDSLALLAPEITPPEQLRHRVLAQFHDPSDSGAPSDFDLNRHAPKRFSRAAQFTLVAAAAVILMLAGWAGVLYQDLTQTRDELDQVSAQLRQEQSVLASAPRAIELFDDDQGTGSDENVSENYGRLYVSSQSHEALLVVENLPPTPQGRVYQIWLVQGDSRDDAGTFVTDETGNGRMLIRSPLPLSAYQTLGITEEPAPSGSPGPTGPRIAGCPLDDAAESES